MAIDLEKRRRARHDRVRELESRVNKMRRRGRVRRARGRLWRTARALLIAGCVVAAVLIIPRLMPDGPTSAEVAQEREPRVREVLLEQIDQLERDMVRDVADAVGIERDEFDERTVIEAVGTAVDGWAAPLDLIDADRATRPHHTYAAWDYGTRVGTPVYAMTAGTISSATEDDGARCGGTVSLTTASEGARITYCHLSSVVVERGDLVSAGDLVGETGGAQGAPGAGRSSGPHLHLQITLDGELRCPQAQLVALSAGAALDVADLPNAGCWYRSDAFSFASPAGPGSSGDDGDDGDDGTNGDVDAFDIEDPRFIWDD